MHSQYDDTLNDDLFETDFSDSYNDADEEEDVHEDYYRMAELMDSSNIFGEWD